MKTFSGYRKDKATYQDLKEWLETMKPEQLECSVTIFDWDGMYDTHAVRKDLRVLANKDNPRLKEVECIKFLWRDTPVIGIDSRY